jgi:hypothetical protein
MALSWKGSRCNSLTSSNLVLSSERNQMKSNVNKEKLLAALTENRAKHVETYNDALDGYYAAVAEFYAEQASQAKAHKKVESYLPYSRPQNHSDDYDRVIGMLQWHTAENFDLTEQEYSSYVMDNWAWTGEWRDNSRSFSSSAYAKNYGDTEDDDK